MNTYTKQAIKFKALADPNRLMILEMLSRGEMCACKILQKFHFTQPTLSHHMKVLCSAGLAVCRREGKWSYYSLGHVSFAELSKYCSGFSMVSE